MKYVVYICEMSFSATPSTTATVPTPTTSATAPTSNVLFMITEKDIFVLRGWVHQAVIETSISRSICIRFINGIG